MYQIIEKQTLKEKIVKITLSASLIARKVKAGQFVILQVDENGERIPLTVADYDRVNGTVTLIYQVVGLTTMKLNEKQAGDCILSIVGPLGNPTETENIKKVCVVGGGVGCAIALPVAKAMKENGAYVVSVIGFRSKEFVILEEEFKKYSDEVIVMTDDGSYGMQGNVCMPLEKKLENGERFDVVMTVGPLIMMKFVALLTKKYEQKTVASMNPLMIDGTGMCGCCRLTVGGKMKFACVDGPEFDAHEIDFDETMSRNTAYRETENKKREEHCNLFLKKVEND